VNLTKGAHKVSLRAGDDLVLVDQRAVILNRPVDIYEGAIVVPIAFKEQIMDNLFKATKVVTERRGGFLVSSQIKRVVIDAGHGGKDPGAIGRSGIREKDINLYVAKRLAALFKSEGVSVVMTRDSDVFIPLPIRVKITNNSKADLFISVHSNANRTRSISGFEVYYVSNSVSDSKRASAAAKSASLNLDNAVFSSPVPLELKEIIWDMLYGYDRSESIYLARNICKSIGSALDVRVIGVKDARYQVLVGARMPAVLIEIGFVSNPGEERLLKDAGYREKLAAGIMDGVRDYAQGKALTEVAKR
jgi:N-acetylmuramoyl-L-alanine amidase